LFGSALEPNSDEDARSTCLWRLVLPAFWRGGLRGNASRGLFDMLESDEVTLRAGFGLLAPNVKMPVSRQ